MKNEDHDIIVWKWDIFITPLSYNFSIQCFFCIPVDLSKQHYNIVKSYIMHNQLSIIIIINNEFLLLGS